MTPERNALLQIHFCVLLWGFTAILGKLISLPALELVWWRMLIVVVVLLAWPPLWRELRAADPRTLAAFSGIGVVVALHWLTFYGAIKLSNASVAASCMAVGPLFLAVLEPWIVRRPFDPRELVVGLIALPGVVLVVGGTPAGMHLGLAVGVLSAFLVAIFGSLNKRYVERGSALLVTGVELAAGTAFLTIVAVAWHGRDRGSPCPDPVTPGCSRRCRSVARCCHLRSRCAHCATPALSWHSSPSASSRSMRSCWRSCCWASSASSHRRFIWASR